MLRKEIEKYVKKASDLREKIKNEQNEEKKQELINELEKVYSKLEFYRKFLYAKNLKERSNLWKKYLEK